MKILRIALLLFFASVVQASALICSSVPYTFLNGTIADATQVNANFAGVLGCVNTGAATSGANSNITGLFGLTTPLSVAQGGTGQATSLFPIANGNLATMTTLTLKGNLTGATATPVDVPVASVLALVPAAATVTDFKNLVGTVTSGTAGTYTADALTVEVPGGASYRLNSYSQAFATGTAGAGGLDTGAIAASTWYYVWAAYNPVAPATTVFLSLSSTAPTMPAGYTAKQRIGSVQTNAVPALSLQTQRGRAVQRVTPVRMAAGVVGNVSTPTWVAIPLANFVPPTAARVRGSLSSGATLNAQSIIAPNNGYGGITTYTNFPPVSVNTVGNTGNVSITTFDFVIEGANIYWASFNDGVVNCSGYDDNL